MTIFPRTRGRCKYLSLFLFLYNLLFKNNRNNDHKYMKLFNDDDFMTIPPMTIVING